KSILKIDPTQFELMKKIGSLYEKKREFEEALKYYEQYADQFPENSSSYTTIGDLYKSFGNYQQAKKFYGKAILLEPEKISILISLANIEEISGNFQNTLEQYENSLNLCKTPRDLSEVYLALGSYFETRGQMNKSIEYLKKEINEYEKFQSPFVLIFSKFAYLIKYIQIGKKELAFETIETMKTQFSPPLDKIIAVGNLKIYEELEDAVNIEKAIEEVEILIKTFSLEMLRPLIFSAKGKIHVIKEEFKQAILMYQKVLDLKPTGVTINMDIGICYRKIGEFKKAEKFLQKTVKILPFNPKTNYELALLYNDMGKKEKALEHLNITLEIWKDADPEYIPAQKAREKLQEWEATN
ncbi:MAG: tetratricopeptide repeat protein, partial [Candidatus Cloacimonetes bacterium]|nr:tetratricopeptide repeat protein [Candidatus Cloacimonadota bacterium]